MDSGKNDWIFYDGHCALCHWGVKFAMGHDPEGNLFRFAPLQGKRILSEIPVKERLTLPDSFVIWTGDKNLLLKSSAVVYLLKKCGRFWGAMGFLLGILPRFLRDGAYDLVARVRYRVFGKKQDLCPVIPPEFKNRFDLT